MFFDAWQKKWSTWYAKKGHKCTYNKLGDFVFFKEIVSTTKIFRNGACANLITIVKEEIRNQAAQGKINAEITVTDVKESHIYHVVALLREDGFDVHVCMSRDFNPIDLQISWKIFEV